MSCPFHRFSYATREFEASEQRLYARLREQRQRAETRLEDQRDFAEMQVHSARRQEREHTRRNQQAIAQGAALLGGGVYARQFGGGFPTADSEESE
jgi:hypothetical protein